MQDTANRLRLIWADKIVFWLALLSAVLMAIAWVFIAAAAGPIGANHVLASFGWGGIAEGVAGLLAFWAGLRALDFAFGGATHKLFYAERQDDVAALPARENLLAH